MKQTGNKSMLSVAMCTYNGELYLQEQLISIAKQTRLPDELVVCDDGSTDTTLQILNEFQEKVPFLVKIYRNETNLGSTKNFEKTITLCNGDIIALSDHDDVWMSFKLEKLEQALEDHPEAGYVFSDALVTDEILRPLGYTMWDRIAFTTRQRRHFEQGHQLRILLKGNVVTGATMAFRAELRNQILSIPEQWVHDAWIALIASAVGKKGVFVEKPLIYYRQHPRQVIGAPKNNRFYEQVQRALSAKGKAYNLERIKYLQIIDRLVALNIINQDTKKLIKDKIRHLEARQLLYECSLLKRIKIPLRELMAGRYHKFSNGWKSAAKDLFIAVK